MQDLNDQDQVLPRRIFVTGGTGYLGTGLIPQLNRRGHEVSVLVRPESAQKLPIGLVTVNQMLKALVWAIEHPPSELRVIDVPEDSPSGKSATMKPMALVTGAAGLIGSYLVRTAWRWAPHWQVCGITRQDADLMDQGQVKALWSRLQPQAIIHCAALSRAGQCEENPVLARQINVEATQRLAELAHDIPFVFLSSDQVFDGTEGGYVESDQVNPLNVYGQTKAEAEQVVLQNPAHSVVRVALTAGTSPTLDRSFVEDMLRASVNGTRLTLFTDEFRCPLPAGVIARAIWELIERDRPGLYHLGGGERLSRWEIGELLARWYPQLRPCIQPGSLADYQGPPRPPDLSMCSDKIQQLLSFRLPGLRQWVSAGSPEGDDPWDDPCEA